MAELQVADFPVSPAPNERVTKDSELYELLAVNATFDGSAASGDWLPAVEIVSSAGLVVARHVAGEAVAAGESVEVTFAPFLGRSTSTARGFIRYDFDNQGGYLDSTTNDVSPDSNRGTSFLDDSGGGIELEVRNNGGMDLISSGTEGRGIGTYIGADSGIEITTSDEAVKIIAELDNVDVEVAGAGEFVVKEFSPLTRLFSVSGNGIVTVENGPLTISGLVTASSGIDNGGNRITNGADGIDPTDFATVEQLPTFTGVESLAKSGDTPLTGDVTLSEGANVTLTQVGQDIEIATAPGSGGIDFDLANSGDWLDIQTTSADAGGLGVDVEDAGGGGILLHSTGEAQLNGDGAAKLVSGLTTLFVSPGFVQAFLQAAGIFQVLDSGSLPVFEVDEVGAVGFFGVTPAAQQATPVTLGDVIALLQTFGLAA